MIDNIAISGRAGGDPTVTTTGTGLAVASFSVATDYVKRDANGQFDRDNKETNWYRVVSFGPLASGVASAVRKGRNVVVSGRLRIVPWENDDGRRGTKVEIVADSVGIDLRWSTGPVTPPAAPVRQTAPEPQLGAAEQQAVASDGAPAAEGTTDLASSGDSWLAPGVTREEAMADADTPF